MFSPVPIVGSLSSGTFAFKGTGTFPIFDPKRDQPESLSTDVGGAAHAWISDPPSCLLMLPGNHKLWMADASAAANLPPPLRCCHVPEKAEVAPPPMLISRGRLAA